MRCKDRVTGYVCTNGDGLQKLSMDMIGKSKNSRWFRLGPPAVPFFSRKNAYSDTVTFKRWCYDVFLPYVRNNTSRNVILFMNNCGPHGTDLSGSRGQFQILTLLPKFTALHQPMDLGIIGAGKTRYRGMILKKILTNIETRQQRTDSSNKCFGSALWIWNFCGGRQDAFESEWWRA